MPCQRNLWPGRLRFFPLKLNPIKAVRTSVGKNKSFITSTHLITQSSGRMRIENEKGGRAWA